jgi:hypothetical protein
MWLAHIMLIVYRASSDLQGNPGAGLGGKATVIRTTSKKSVRTTTQLEDIHPDLQSLVDKLGLAIQD